MNWPLRLKSAKAEFLWITTGDGRLLNIRKLPFVGAKRQWLVWVGSGYRLKVGAVIRANFLAYGR